MPSWSLQDIRTKVRRVTGRLSPQEMTDAQVNDYINKYYQYTLPAELKLDKLHTYYNFLTEQNQAFYTAPDAMFTNYEPLATIDLFKINWYQDPSAWYWSVPQNITRSTPWTGDGVTHIFTTQVTGQPIFPGTLVCTDNFEVFQDTNQNWTDENVTISGSQGGDLVVNYSTGTVTVDFADNPLNGEPIALSYQLFQPGRPQSVLYYNSQFRFDPVPDTAYRFSVKAYITLTPLLTDDASPKLDEWGPCIAYGAARDISADFGENDAYAEITVLYKEQVSYIITRTEQNLLNTRSAPFF